MSDNGPQFVSKEFETFLVKAVFGICAVHLIVLGVIYDDDIDNSQVEITKGNSEIVKNEPLEKKNNYKVWSYCKTK